MSEGQTQGEGRQRRWKDGRRGRVQDGRDRLYNGREEKKKGAGFSFQFSFFFLSTK
jgi:hypothetical protein